jgi:polysaccharide export outer membrane protein
MNHGRKGIFYVTLVATFFAWGQLYAQQVMLRSSTFTTSAPVNYANQTSDYKLQPFDQLFIYVTSPNPSSTDYLNPMNGVLHAGATDEAWLNLNSFNLNEQGEIYFPILGKVALAGKTLNETGEILKNILVNIVQEPIIHLKLANFRVTLLGEFQRPGTYQIHQGQMNLLEALGLAGDLTKNAKFNAIKMIRRKNKGTEVILIDLSDPNFLRSEYFYIRPGDIIYAEPLK